MVQKRTALVNQLHETLTTLYPELGRVLANLNSPTCLALLIAYPGPQHISRAGEEKAAEILAALSRGRAGKVEAKALLEAARTTVGVIQRQPALAIKVSILGQRLITSATAIEGVLKVFRLVVIAGSIPG